MGWSSVNLLGQVVLGCRQDAACMSLVWILLACCACGAGGAGVGCLDHGGRGC